MVQDGRRARFIAVSSGLVSLFVGLVSAPSAVATTVATSAPPIPVTVTAAGISLAYPSGWTSIELTPHGFTDQVQRLAKTDPVKASIIKSRGANPRFGAEFHAFDLDAAARGLLPDAVRVDLIPALGPKLLDSAATVLAAGYKRIGTVRVRLTRRLTIDGVPALRSELTLTPPAKEKLPPMRVSQLVLAQKGGTWVLVTVTTENSTAGAAFSATMLGGVHVIGRPVPGPGPLQLRPVLAALPPATSTVSASGAASAAIASCDVNQIAALPEVPTTDSSPDTCVVLPFKSRDVKGRLYLGPVRLTTADLDSATSSFQSGTGYVIDMKLTKVGLAKFNRLAADLHAKSEPQNEVAIVVNGQVYSSPAFQSDSFAGPIQVSGSFSSAEASALAKELNRATLIR